MRIIRVAMPVEVTRKVKVKMTKPAQWAFDARAVDNGYGGAVDIVFEPNVSSEDEIDTNHVNLDQSEKTLLENAVAKAAKAVGGRSYFDGINPFSQNIRMRPYSEEDERSMTEQEVATTKSAVPKVKSILQRMGFFLDEGVAYDMDAYPPI